MKKIYPSILNLHSYQVLPDFDEKGTSKIFDVDISQPVTYGKTIFFITYKIDKGNKDFFLRPGSEIKCEVLDSRGKNIYTDFIPFRKVSGQGIGYIRIDDSLLERSDGWLIQDGGGTIILMGQLAGDSIPPEWRDTYNCRFEYPIKIHKELPNTSPLFFNTSGSNDFPLLDVHETLEFDVDTQAYPDETYKRSFANIVLDNLHTVGGRTNFSEISYNPVSASTDDNTILDTIPISSSEMLLGRIANVGISGLTDTGSLVTSDSVADKSQFSSHSYGDVLLQNPSEEAEIARWFQWMQLYPQSSDLTKGLKSYPFGHAGFDNKYLEAIKIFRYAYEDEEYTIDFLGSGSFKLVVAESPYQNDLTASFLPGIDSLEDSSGNGNPTYNDQLLGRYDTLSDFGSGNLNVIYTQSIHDWDPYTASKWIQDTTKVHPSNIVSRSDGAYVRDSFTISSGSYASLHVMMSPHIGTSWSSSMKYISIRPKENSGSNVPFYYHKIQMPPRRRNEVINFNSKFLNPNMEVAQDLNQSDTNLVVSSSNFFTGSPLIIEGDDGIFGGALRSRGYRGYKNASTTDGGAGFILYSGSIDTSGDFGSDGEYTGGVGFELHGGHNRDALKFSTETGELEITGSVLIEGVMTASSGEIGGWNIGESSLFHSSSTNQMILSGSKGTIDMFSGSNAFPSLQIASDINEDEDDALASPGMFIQDGVIFLKRTSGSMPAGAIKGGVQGFQQVGTRIKPGFLNLFMSGSNTDSHQRLADEGSMFKLHGVNMNQSASGLEKTRMLEIDWQADKGHPIPSSNSQYHYNIYSKAVTTSASLQGIYVHLDANYDGQVQHMDPNISYLGWFESNEPTHSDLYRFQIKNSDFVISKQGEQDSPSDLHKHVWYRPMSQSFAISTMGSGPDSIVDTDEWSAIDAATSESAVGYLGNTYDYYPSLQIINTQKYAAAGEYSSSIPQSPLWVGRNYEGKITSSLYVSASGEVGVGTTTPHATLEVSGSISSSGNIDIAPNRFIRSTREDGVQRELLGYAGSPSILQINNSNNDRETRIFGEGITVYLVDSGMKVLGPISSSNKISASNNIYAQAFLSNGNAGISSTATHLVVGNQDQHQVHYGISHAFENSISASSLISASGDISSSGFFTPSGVTSSIHAVTASHALNGGGGGSTNAAGSDKQVQFNDGGTNFGGDAGFTYDKDDNSITAINNITASGNISASLDNYQRVIYNSAGAIFNNDGGNATVQIKGGTDDYLIATNTSGNDRVGIGQLPAAGKSKLQITGDVSVTTHVTASGNISASLTVFGEHFYSSDDIIAASTIQGAQLVSTGNVTASNNISASGTYYGKQREHTYHQFDNPSNSNANYIPAPGGYIVESTSINYYRQWLAPYDGNLIKCIINAENDPDNTRLSFYIDGSYQARKTVAMDANTPATFDMTDMDLTPTNDDCSFSQGDLLALAMQPINAPGEVNLVCTWEYKIND